MKYLSICVLFALAACGSGGGGSSSGGGGYTPGGPTRANTALAMYLPLAVGNTWTFATGARITDTGRGPLQCSCDANGTNVDALDIIDTAGAYNSTLYFQKYFSPRTNSSLTVFMGTSSTKGGPISLIFSSTGSTGIPVMDDNPQVGEFWTSPSGNSTITSINSTQSYGSNQFVDHVATDTISGANVTWAFAQGVGFASVTAGGQTTLLVSFSVSPSSSLSAAVSTESLAPAVRSDGSRVTPAQMSRILAAFR